MEQAERRVAAFEEDRFGDLDLEPVRREPAVGQRAQDTLVEGAAVELDRGHVDGDTDMLGPAGRASAGFADHPGADRDDQAGVLGHGHEVCRRNQTELGMPPAQQCLERADAVLLEVEQRLVDQLELASLQCQAQIRLQLTSLLGAFVEAFLEEGVSAAAGLLGAI